MDASEGPVYAVIATGTAIAFDNPLDVVAHSYNLFAETRPRTNDHEDPSTWPLKFWGVKVNNDYLMVAPFCAINGMNGLSLLVFRKRQSVTPPDSELYVLMTLETPTGLPSPVAAVSSSALNATPLQVLPHLLTATNHP